MMVKIDLQRLAERESEQVEWKRNVADINNIVKTLSAFANDLANLGGGYVVCGAEEEKDEHGFARLVQIGLTASRFKEVEGEVLARCRNLVAPAIAPLVEELPAPSGDRRILIFIQPATAHAHTFRSEDGGRHYVRISRETREARNGVLRDLLVRKAAIPPWDHRPCNRATVADLDLLALREALTRMETFDPEHGVDPFLAPDEQLHALIPSLCVVEPLTGVIRPRNFAVLLFGRTPQKFIPGAFSLFSIYPGRDRSDPHAERHEIGGTVLEQASRLTALLSAQASTVFDKIDVHNPNKVRYPLRALTEGLSNTLAHRDYELYDPVRITAFSDRIEFVSPGALPLGIDRAALEAGRVGPRWRNQVLAWFFNRLGLAQAEGQGIKTMRRAMDIAGCPAPAFEADVVRVTCTLGSNPHVVQIMERLAVEPQVAPPLMNRKARRDAVLQAILTAGSKGIQRSDLLAKIPQATEMELRTILRYLSRIGKIHYRGATATARWYPGPREERL